MASEHEVLLYGTSMRDLLRELHSLTARDLNQMDGAEGRAVWHNFWDTELTFEKSYLARLNYVHQNPVKHELVPVANAIANESLGAREVQVVDVIRVPFVGRATR